MLIQQALAVAIGKLAWKGLGCNKVSQASDLVAVAVEVASAPKVPRPKAFQPT
jgi:hypothetical protein